MHFKILQIKLQDYKHVVKMNKICTAFVQYFCIVFGNRHSE